MRSDEVLREVIHNHGVKAVAADMRLSTSLLYKWCQPKEDPDASGADNPLDRLQRLVEITSDTRPVHWLCQACKGFFVENPSAGRNEETAVLEATQKLLAEFSEMLGAVSSGYQDDRSIDQQEAQKIRKEWEDLKTLAEQFVTACERGVFREEDED